MDHPAQIGPYTVQRLLGEGGSAFVYQGYDPRLQRRVALKVLKLPSPDWIERLKQEALLQARLQHPQLVQIYDVGESEGHSYLAMQYIPGVTLGEAVKPLHLEAKVRLMAQVADAVHAAHRQGLIHRDLKPSNVLVTTDEAGLASPHVVDFGLARLWEGQSLTAPGQIMGSPAYMAPEQARGESVDPRADVYGLGATLFEVLSGRPPFQGSDVVSLLLKVLQEEAPALEAVLPGVPPELAAIVHHCLEKDPARRYPSAGHLRDDLHRYLDGEVVSVRRPSPLQRAAKWVARNRRLALILGGSALLTLGLGTSLAYSQLASARQARFAQDLGRTLAELDGQLQRAYLLPPHDIAPLKRDIRRRLAEMESMGGQMKKRGRAALELALGRGYLALDDHPRALDHLQRAETLGETGPDPAMALGLAHANLYLDGLLSIDPRAEDKRKVLQRRHRDPALGYLNRFRGGSAMPELIGGLIAVCEDREVDALRSLAAVRTEGVDQLEPLYLKGRIHLILGRNAFHRGTYDEATAHFREGEAAFRRSVELGRTFGKGYFGIGGCRQNLFEIAWVSHRGDPLQTGEAALEAYAQAAKVDTDSALPWARSALVRARLGIHADRVGKDPGPVLQKAWRDVEHSLALDPEDRKVLEGAATIGMIQGDLLMGAGEDPRHSFEEAARWGARLLEKEPGEWAMLKNLGLLHGRLADYLEQRGMDGEAHFEKAENYCKEAVALSTSGLTYWNLGAVLGSWARARLDRTADAGPPLERGLAAYAAGVESNPKLPSLHGELGDLWGVRARLAVQRKEDPDPFLVKAEVCFKKTIALDPADRDIPVFQARIALLQVERAGPPVRERALDRLLAVAKRAAELNPKLVEPWLLRAQGCERAAQWGGDGRWLVKALEDVAQARKRVPKDFRARLLEARLVWLQSRSEPAEMAARKARVRALTDGLLRENPAHAEARRLKTWSESKDP